jgi:hypothetical protein
MKTLLIVTAMLEAATGLGLALAPALTVFMLFGAPLDTPAGLMIGRVAGAALLSLSLACWLAQHDEQSRVTQGLVTAMLFYNTAAVTAFVYAGIGLGLSGSGLWPAVLLHTVLAVRCTACLWSTPTPMHA